MERACCKFSRGETVDGAWALRTQHEWSSLRRQQQIDGPGVHHTEINTSASDTAYPKTRGLPAYG